LINGSPPNRSSEFDSRNPKGAKPGSHQWQRISTEFTDHSMQETFCLFETHLLYRPDDLEFAGRTR
jgi:hypothetical protein